MLFLLTTTNPAALSQLRATADTELIKVVVIYKMIGVTYFMVVSKLVYQVNNGRQ